VQPKPGHDLPTIRARCRKHGRTNRPKQSKITNPSRRERQKLRARLAENPRPVGVAEQTNPSGIHQPPTAPRTDGTKRQKLLAEKVLSKPAKPPDPRARHPGDGPPGSHMAGATLRMDGPRPVSPLKRHTSPLPRIASRVAFPPPPRSPHLLLIHPFPSSLIHPSPEIQIYHALPGLLRSSWA
jgi:hypothetical protein